MDWIHRINAIIPVGDAVAANALWTIIAPEGNAEDQTFGVWLSPGGGEPPTHYGISTAATEEMRLLIDDTYAAELQTAVFSIQDAPNNDWVAFVAANGLQPINEDENGSN